MDQFVQASDVSQIDSAAQAATPEKITVKSSVIRMVIVFIIILTFVLGCFCYMFLAWRDADLKREKLEKEKQKFEKRNDKLKNHIRKTNEEWEKDENLSKLLKDKRKVLKVDKFEVFAQEQNSNSNFPTYIALAAVLYAGYMSYESYKKSKEISNKN